MPKNPEMKIYSGERGEFASGGCKVLVQWRGNTYPLPHVEKHSPDGFQWGYGGSGPADLALSILADYFSEVAGELDESHLRFGGHPATEMYQDFKWAFVSKFAPEWTLEGSEIDEWIQSLKGGVPE